MLHTMVVMVVSGVGDGFGDGGADGYACAEDCALFMDTWIRFDAMLSCTSEPLLGLFCFDLFSKEFSPFYKQTHKQWDRVCWQRLII